MIGLGRKLQIIVAVDVTTDVLLGAGCDLVASLLAKRSDRDAQSFFPDNSTGRKVHHDACALTNAAVQRHTAAMRECEALNDGQSEAGTLLGANGVMTALSKALEDEFLILASDSDSRVGNPKNKFAGGLDVREYPHGPASGGKFHGVGRQVEYDLLERALVRVKFWQGAVGCVYKINASGVGLGLGYRGALGN